MKEIPLTQGYKAIVDDEDYERVAQHKWHVKVSRLNICYAARTIPKFRTGTKNKTVRMHRFIMNCPENLQVDHINHNGLDNRKSNLRLCSALQNQMNSSAKGLKLAPSSSRFKGVAKFKGCNNPWGAHIKTGGKLIRIGWFKEEAQAAMAYNEAAKKYFGEFACLNQL